MVSFFNFFSVSPFFVLSFLFFSHVVFIHSRFFVYLSTRESVCVCVCLSVCLFLRTCFCLTVCLSFLPSFLLSQCFSSPSPSTLFSYRACVFCIVLFILQHFVFSLPFFLFACPLLPFSFVHTRCYSCRLSMFVILSRPSSSFTAPHSSAFPLTHCPVSFPIRVFVHLTSLFLLPLLVLSLFFSVLQVFLSLRPAVWPHLLSYSFVIFHVKPFSFASRLPESLLCPREPQDPPLWADNQGNLRFS